MKIKLYIIFIFLLTLNSCGNTNPDVKNRENNTYSFKSDTGNMLEISLPGQDIYSFEKTTMTIKLLYNKNVSPLLPDWSELEDTLNIVDVRDVLGPIEENDFILRVQEITIGSLLPGDYIINPLYIPFYSENLIVDEIRSDIIPLKILSSLIEGEDDIVDTMFFLQSKKNYFLIVISIVIVLLFLITGLYIVFYRRKLQKKTGFTDSLIKNYEELIRDGNEDDVHILYKNMNSVIKEFLDNKLFLSVQSQTTEEFIDYSKVSPIIENWLKKQLYDFLKRSDEVKFGLRVPDKERIAGDKKFCTDFIDYINKKIIEGVTL